MAATIARWIQYACLAPHAEDARAVQELHYPSQQLVPSDAAERVVTPGGRSSFSLAERLLADARGKSVFMLQLFGRSLHPLSLAHQGVPVGPPPLPAGIRCDARLTMSAALDRQHWIYRDAELMRNWQPQAGNRAWARHCCEPANRRSVRYQMCSRSANLSSRKYCDHQGMGCGYRGKLASIVISCGRHCATAKIKASLG